jgi:hypothetical protein
MSLFTETDRSLFAQTTRAASPEDRVSAHARPVVTARCMLMIDVAHCMAVNWRLYNDKTGATSDVSVFHLPQLANVILVPLYRGWGGKDWGRGGGTPVLFSLGNCQAVHNCHQADCIIIASLVYRPILALSPSAASISSSSKYIVRSGA